MIAAISVTLLSLMASNQLPAEATNLASILSGRILAVFITQYLMSSIRDGRSVSFAVIKSMVSLITSTSFIPSREIIPPAIRNSKRISMVEVIPFLIFVFLTRKFAGFCTMTASRKASRNGKNIQKQYLTKR